MRRKEKERPGGVRDLNGASDAKLNTDHLAFTTLSECSKRSKCLSLIFSE